MRFASSMAARLALTILPGLVLVPAQARACSQCMCGNPFPTDVLGVSQPFSLRYGIEDRYLSKSSALDDQFGDEVEQTHRLAPFLLFRSSPGLMFSARLPYVFKQVTQTPTGGTQQQVNSRGVGDAELVGYFEAADAGKRGTIALITGLTAPTGSNDLTSADGQRLDAHSQPGTGAWSGTLGADYNVTTGIGRFDLNASGRWNGTSAHGYHYGNTALYNAGLTRRAGGDWQWMLQANGRTATHDRLEEGGTGMNTGGTVIYLAPGVRWLGFAGLALEAAVQLPVIEALYGVQNEHATGRFALSYAP